mmetsp:Transcript_144219/g.401884  ORF Transcript_144219/g.401884 Transcript_144219/m.401884 type:complete len:113 (+) Transcript_144219:1477-1815(+)
MSQVRFGLGSDISILSGTMRWSTSARVDWFTWCLDAQEPNPRPSGSMQPLCGALTFGKQTAPHYSVLAHLACGQVLLKAFTALALFAHRPSGCFVAARDEGCSDRAYQAPLE